MPFRTESLLGAIVKVFNVPVCRLVSANWLRRWADSIQPLPVDNSELLCSHGKLHPDKFKGDDLKCSAKPLLMKQ